MLLARTTDNPAHSSAGFTAACMGATVAATRTSAKRDLQERQRAWLRDVERATGLKPAQIAKASGNSISTLTRFLNNPEYPGVLSQVTIDRIKDRFNFPGPEAARTANNKMLLGFAEAERVDTGKETGELARIINAMLNGRDGWEPWRLRGLSLENAGYLPGDIVIVDTTATPKAHDAVCVQVADYQHGAAETVFRVYDPPFVLGAGRERTSFKTLLVDDARVSVRGVIVNAFRPHRLSAAPI